MVHPMNHIWRISNLHCALSVILLNLYGISIDNCFYPFLSYMIHPTNFLTSVGLSQGHPNYVIFIYIPTSYISYLVLVICILAMYRSTCNCMFTIVRYINNLDSV